MDAPVEYISDFIRPPELADFLFGHLMGLDWVQRDNTPRAEYYCNDTPAPYTYGVREGERTYQPQPWTPHISTIRVWVENHVGAKMDVCFLNRYDDARKALSWHADDSPEMDPARPVVTVSLGAERDIQFRRKDVDLGNGLMAKKVVYVPGFPVPKRLPDIETLTLGHGSMAVMAPGMQQTWQHRIPKSGRIVGPRISLTFRGYLPQYVYCEVCGVDYHVEDPCGRH